MPGKSISSVNTGAYNSQVQDSHMLHVEGEVLALLVKRYQDAVKRGDPQEIVSIVNGLRAHVNLAALWTKTLAPEIIESHPLLDGQESGEHSYSQ
jgi:hypothetical protein